MQYLKPPNLKPKKFRGNVFTKSKNRSLLSFQLSFSPCNETQAKSFRNRAKKFIKKINFFLAVNQLDTLIK